MLWSRGPRCKVLGTRKPGVGTRIAGPEIGVMLAFWRINVGRNLMTLGGRNIFSAGSPQEHLQYEVHWSWGFSRYWKLLAIWRFWKVQDFEGEGLEWNPWDQVYWWDWRTTTHRYDKPPSRSNPEVCEHRNNCGPTLGRSSSNRFPVATLPSFSSIVCRVNRKMFEAPRGECLHFDSGGRSQ